MKKLMIAAVAACAVGTLFASNCEILDEYVCAYAYRVKLAGKTVKGKEKAATSACSTGACWAKPASLRIAGYIYNAGTDASDDGASECSCECGGHWDLQDNVAVFWNSDKAQVLKDVASAEVDVYNVLRNSGSKNIVQIGLKLGDLYLAGFGDYNPSTKRLKRAHGFFAGTLDSPACESLDGETCEITSDVAQVFAPCDLENSVDCEKAVAFGRWKLAWKAEKVALLTTGNDPLAPGVLVPAAFTPAN